MSNYKKYGIISKVVTIILFIFNVLACSVVALIEMAYRGGNDHYSEWFIPYMKFIRETMGLTSFMVFPIVSIILFAVFLITVIFFIVFSVKGYINSENKTDVVKSHKNNIIFLAVMLVIMIIIELVSMFM